MLREVKFYARDILRGPLAKTPVGYHVSWVLVGLLAASPLIYLLH